jgi:undecaprenyl-diphosphatase
MANLVEARTLPLRALDAETRRRLRWTAIAFALVFLALALVVIAAGHYAKDLNESVRVAVARERHPWLKQPMRAISWSSSGVVLVPLTLIASAWLWRCSRPVAIALPVIALATGIASSAAKWIVGTPRPRGTAYGFPSGHVFGAVVFFGMAVYLLWALGVHRRWRIAAVVVSVVAVSAVAMSRLYVNAHWLTDVLGSVAGGASLLLFAVVLVDRLVRDER